MHNKLHATQVLVRSTRHKTTVPDGSTVSVVMATFNGEQFILEQLESIATQTSLPREVTIGDDGSTDRTLAIASRFADRAPFPVTIFKNPIRLGYGQNFLTTAMHATGHYIAFCDQDDIWSPDKLNRAVEALERDRGHLYVHTATVIDATGQPIDFFAQGIRRKRIIEPLQLPPWGVFYGFSMVFRAEILSAMNSTDRGNHTFEVKGYLSHDLWVYFVATSLGRTVVDDMPLAMYRRHGRNATPDLTGSVLDKLSQFFGVRAHPELKRDMIAAHRSRALAAFAASSISHPLTPNAAIASRYWARISRFEALRIAVYTQPNILRRLTSWLLLTASGGYRSYSSGGLSWRQSIKDVLIGVFQLKRKSK
jgi:glycosyltransferase involved in cell wall biosynthesis